MNGNDHAQLAKELLQGSTKVDILAQQNTMIAAAGVHAQLAVAWELRTRNLLAAQSTPEWLNEARVRLGHETFPPGGGPAPFLDPRPVPVVDPRCSLPLMDGRNEIRCWLKTNHEGECK
jgi:hypothetical protein